MLLLSDVFYGFDRAGKWYYEENQDKEEYETQVPMPDGSTSRIDHLSVGTSRETLGVWTAPNGNPNGALVAMQDKAQEWVDKAKEGSLRRRDVCFLLDCQFWPRVGYGLSCCTAEHQLLEKCLKRQHWQLIPLGGVIRTAPASSRQLSKGFFGVGCWMSTCRDRMPNWSSAEASDALRMSLQPWDEDGCGATATSD